ncbi:hypothetical protein NHX12_022297 [Muraenolepis orangiensis]|uniref:Uncharacterized protein n=1 Tax=Muraenolepis orangiensis TaxID=630683 RepID=A0A9Q0ER87_9TELE|nr:hypothetical protein NHX12_022297 [Muraenolepis orangiensis]
MQFFREAFCRPCSARVTSPQEDMEYRMGNCIGNVRNQQSDTTEQLILWPSEPGPLDLLLYNTTTPTPPPPSVYGTGTGSRERTEQNTEASSLSLLPDIPVVSGVAEEEEGERNRGFGGFRGREEDQEDELEFPHDLLPSLDFSSDLNIWESSLG